MYDLDSKLFAHVDAFAEPDAARRVAALENAMGQTARRFTNDGIPTIAAERAWGKRRGRRYGEQVNPPDPDIVLTCARWETTEADEELLASLEGPLRNLGSWLLGRNAFSFFSSGQQDYHRPCPDHVCRPAWRLNTMNGCPHRCAYCGLGGVHVAMVNIEAYKQHLGQLIEHNPWETVYLFNDTSDTLVLEPEIDHVHAFIEFFKQWPDRWFVVHTKSANVDHLLELDHQRRCVMLFSITSPTASRLFEPGAPTCEERLAAARKCYEAGYPVRIKFKPIIPVRNWREEAHTMAKLACDGMKPELINLFALSWMPIEEVERAFDVDALDPEFIEQARKAEESMQDLRVKPFPHGVRTQIYSHFLEAIRRVDPELPVTLSTETLDMWKEFGPRLGYGPADYICGCGARAEPGIKRLKESPWASCRPVTWQGEPILPTAPGATCE